MHTLKFIRFTRYASLILLLTGLPACGREVVQPKPMPSQETKTHAEEAERKPAVSAKIRTEPVRSTLLRVPVKTTGEIALNTERMAHVTSRVSGWVEEVFAFQEDQVEAGQVLARIYSPDYLTAQTEFFLAEDRLRRAGEDPEEKRVGQAVLEASKSRLRLLGVPEERIESLHREHDEEHRVSPFLEVRAPLGGTVIESTVGKGKAVSSGEALYKIADLSRLWVLVDIYEKDLAQVRQGVPVRITTVAYPGAVFQGRLVLLSGIQQEKTRTVKGRVVVENPYRKLRPGMFVEAELLTAPREAER
jgi:Cu(I)/Ag(I) efflux system membrane fusion protein